jgi:hypothetical protein
VADRKNANRGFLGDKRYCTLFVIVHTLLFGYCDNHDLSRITMMQDFLADVMRKAVCLPVLPLVAYVPKYKRLGKVRGWGLFTALKPYGLLYS